MSRIRPSRSAGRPADEMHGPARGYAGRLALFADRWWQWLERRLGRLGALARAGAVAALAGACAASAGTPGAVSEPGTGVPDGAWVRRVAPFPVRAADGGLYAHPFVGGFDVPRPQLVDIDGDGDPDLFVQERTGAVMFFENRSETQAAAAGAAGPELPVFEWRTDRFQALEVGEWNRFVDLDHDGDLDLLAEQPFSYIRYYENVGSATEPDLRPAADSLRDVAGDPIFSDRQNIPSVADVDCDGALDLFLGRVDGTVVRYEETEPGVGPPRFQLVSERFQGIEIVAQIGQPVPRPPDGGGAGRETQSRPSLHGANSMYFGDIDGDGDPDLLWGDFFEPGLLLIRNTGSCERPSMRGAPVPAPTADTLATSGYNAPYLADLDGDGDRDLFLGVLGGAFNPNRSAADNLYYFERVGELFHLRTRRFVTGIDVGSESLPVPVDWDGDGDLDLVVSNKIDPGGLDASRLYLFENVGTARAPAYALADTLAINPSYHQAPAFGDLDADGDPDLLLGTWNDGIALYRNRGSAQSPAFALEDSAYIQLTRGSNSAPALVDIDDDGDLDLFVGESSGDLNYYRNDGTAREPRFSLVSDEYAAIDVGRRSVPAFLDIDGDGDLDLVLGRESGPLAVYRNDGTRRRPRFVEAPGHPLAGLPLQAFSTPAFADIDGDGDLDLLAGGRSGGVLFYERR